MEKTETTAADTSGHSERTRELIRPVSGRMLAGVAQGIANNLGISEWIPRVVFVVTAFMGGLGLALYAAGWAFIRSEDEASTPAERFFSGTAGSSSWIGLGLILIAGVIVLSNFTILSGDVVWAGALLVVGLLLYLGYIPGWDRSRDDDTDTEVSRPKEGVQQMTTSETSTTTDNRGGPGDSPAGGPTPPPPPPAPPRAMRPPSPLRERSMLGRLTIGLVALGLGVMAILDNVGALNIDLKPYHYLALAVTVLGVGLLVGAFFGRARWLILVSAIVVPTLLFSPFFGYDFDSRNFDLRTSPNTFTELEPEYDIDVGNIVIDLTDLPWEGEEVVVNASINAGNLEIRVPDGVGIIGTARVNIGRVSEPGRSSSGLGDPNLAWDERGALGTVQLSAHVNVGNIDIRR